MNPHVTFRLNKRLDKQMVAEFLRYREKAGFDFAAMVLEDHPELKSHELDRVYIDNYVESYYCSHKKELFEAKKTFQHKWDKIEGSFMIVVNEIFKSQHWPKGKYNGYISIIQCGPRFLKSSEFQSSLKWERNLVSQVIHEMLHFQFFETARQMSIDQDQEGLWTLSEIFNDVVQQEDAFTKIQGYKVGISYPDHIKEYERYKAIWEKDRDVKSFILKGLASYNLKA